MVIGAIDIISGLIYNISFIKRGTRCLQFREKVGHLLDPKLAGNDSCWLGIVMLEGSQKE